MTSTFKDDLLACLPNLRAFALAQCHHRQLAEDLVQETLLRAWAHRDRFEPGSNMAAWLFTILRNHHRSLYRRQRRELEDVGGAHAAELIVAPDQQSRLDLQDFRAALQHLSPDQREALLLVGAEGFSYQQAAAIGGCAVGTIKSRVNRARVTLALLLSEAPPQASEIDARVELAIKVKDYARSKRTPGR